jgi:hypothetical protein
VGVSRTPAIPRAPGAPTHVQYGCTTSIGEHRARRSEITRSFEPTDTREVAAEQVLALLATGQAYTPHELALAPIPTPELRAAIGTLGELPVLRVRCRGQRCNGYRLAKWQLDPRDGIVKPLHRTTSAHTGRAVPFLDRANAGKGPIRPGNTHDGLGTQSYVCPTCRRDVPLSPDSRLRLYVEALARHDREVWI